MALPNEIGRTPLRHAIVTVVCWLIGGLFALPFLFMITSSLRPGRDILANLSKLTWHTFIPREWTFSNYSTLFNGNFGRAVANSLIVSAATVIIGLMLCSLAAFGLSALRFRGAGLLFGLVVLSFLIPFDAIAIPLSALFRDWGLTNTYLGLLLPGIGNGLAIFVLRQFFLGIPWELTEAARVDGLNWFGIYLRIYLPLSKPALIGAGFTLFLFQWQAYLWPLLIGTAPDKTLGPIALANLNGQFKVDFGAIFAGSVLLTIVPAVLLLAFQRHFTGSLAATTSKE